jgi:hypothetical protein
VDLNGWPRRPESVSEDNMALIVEAPSRVPPTVAQQIFTIGSAIAGGLAGIVVARKFAKVQDVPTSQVAGATLISVLFTLGAGLYLAKQGGYPNGS